jgi:hypothetical protein
MLAAACGGTTIIDAGSGGAGGGSTSTGASGTTSTTSTTSSGTTSTNSTTTGPGDCGTLGAAMLDALDGAMRCDSCSDGPDPCDYLSGQQLTDQCGCPMPVNLNSPDAVKAALDAYQAWTGAGCGPLDCGQPCAVSSDPTCQQAGPGCTGSCLP